MVVKQKFHLYWQFRFGPKPQNGLSSWENRKPKVHLLIAVIADSKDYELRSKAWTTLYEGLDSSLIPMSAMYFF